MKSLELLEQRIKSFDAWLENENEKITACEDRIQSDMELVDQYKTSIKAKTEEMLFFKDLYEAMKEDLDAKKIAARKYVEGVEDTEEKAKAKSFCIALGIEIEEDADENETEDEEREEANEVVEHLATG